ncbi:MAG: FHA domain-containing protein [Planctomycetes bacterium]|nr:FHA domain-containing protein [Planctomycetota bacterium]
MCISSFDEQTQRYNANDLKSKHGTFINGRKINGETELHEGDKIDIGKTTLLFSLKDFDDRKTALDHSKKVGQRFRETMYE